MLPELFARRASRTALLTAVLGFGAGCAGGGRTPVVIYSPHGRDLLRLFESRFEAANPDIDIRALDMGSQEVLDRIRSERTNPQADIWFGAPSNLFSRAVDDSLLAPFRPSWADAIEPRSQGRNDMFFSVYETPAIIAYNTDAVSEDEVPRDWDDVLDPKWTGRVLIRNPVASGTMRAVFGMVILRGLNATGDTAAGFDWLRRLDAQTRDYPLNPALLHQQLLRQEGVVTLWDLPDILVEGDRGNPFGFVMPSSGAPVIEDGIALVRDARNPAAARRFIEWVGSVEAQVLAASVVFRLPARNDIPADSLPEWANEVKRNLVVEEMDWDRVAREGAGWMNYWDREVRGKGVPR